MLTELKNARQIKGEGFRRWFTDADMDLVVWYTNDSCADVVGSRLITLFKKTSNTLPPRVVDLVQDRIARYPQAKEAYPILCDSLPSSFV